MQIGDLRAAREFAQTGIYKIVNILNGIIYVGSAVNIKKRWQWHKKDLRANKHRNSYLQNAWNLHGEECFEFSVIEYCEETQLLEREQNWIDTLNSVRPNGYNLAPIAGNC